MVMSLINKCERAMEVVDWYKRWMRIEGLGTARGSCGHAKNPECSMNLEEAEVVGDRPEPARHWPQGPPR